MQPKQKKAIYCILNDEKSGDLIIKVSSTENILVGVDITIVKDDRKTVKENVKIDIPAGQSVKRRLRTPAQALHMMHMAWHILCCSNNPNVYEGEITIEISQGDEPVIINGSDMKWYLDSIPPCSVSVPEQFTGNLTFIVKEGRKKGFLQ